MDPSLLTLMQAANSKPTNAVFSVKTNLCLRPSPMITHISSPKFTLIATVLSLTVVTLLTAIRVLKHRSNRACSGPSSRIQPLSLAMVLRITRLMASLGIGLSVTHMDPTGESTVTCACVGAVMTLVVKQKTSRSFQT